MFQNPTNEILPKKILKNKTYKEQLDEGIRANNYKLTSDKIITTLKTIKNDPNISARRWVWELIQNATDVKYDKEKISIQIILNEDTLEFKHNGKYFTVNNILGLLQQVSSKNSQNLEGQTGKFGTGLIGTHLLSDIIDVKGILCKEENNFCEFNVKLDRSEKKSEILVEKIKKSIELFFDLDSKPDIFKPKPNYLQNRKETDYDTIFIYYLTDNEKKQAAKDGLSDLINTLPTTLITQYKKIKQITIINNINHNETAYIPLINGNEKKNNITELSVKIIKKESEENKEMTFDFLSYLKVDENDKEILRLIQQIKRKNNKIKLLERNKTKPVLYRNFPLIGSNEFNMPFIIDGFDFNPLESRSGLLLNGYKNKDNIDAQENIKILENAFNASIEFIKCMLEQNDFLKNRYLLASSKKPKAIVNFDSDTDKWFLDKQIYLRKELRNFKIVKKENIMN